MNLRLRLCQRLAAYLMASFVMVVAAHAADGQDGAMRLSRGVNLSHWYAQSMQGYGEAHLAGFVSKADLRAIAGAGFNHVRLGLEPSILFASDDSASVNEPVMRRLKEAIGNILDANLAVVVDLHPSGDSKAALSTPEGSERLISQWRNLAGHLASFAPEQVFLEVLNEPEFLKGPAWWALQGRVLSAIRERARRHTVIVNGGGWSWADDLVQHKPYADANVIYTVHWYGPLLFTHQGADWSWEVAREVRNLAWPIARENAVPAADKQDRSATKFLREQIADGQFTLSWMQGQAEKLKDWQESHGRPAIYVGEFGVYAKAAPRDALENWISASRQVFERAGWGWAVWDISPSFGLAKREGNKLAFEKGTLGALGLSP